MNTEKIEAKKVGFKYTPDIVGFTEEEYKKAKAQFGKMFHVKIIDIDGTRSDFMLRRPPMAVMQAAKDSLKKDDEDGANDLLLNASVVCGDMNLLREDYMIYRTVNAKIKELTEASRVFMNQA